MANTKHHDEVLRLLQESLASDVLTDAVSDSDVDRELHEAGGDPDAIAAQGLALATEQLEKRRLAWQDAARRKIGAQQRARQSGPQSPARSRSQLLADIATRRAEFERRGMAVSAAFRKRKPEEASDDELAEFLDELETLANDDETTE